MACILISMIRLRATRDRHGDIQHHSHDSDRDLSQSLPTVHEVLGLRDLIMPFATDTRDEGQGHEDHREGQGLGVRGLA